MRPLTFSLFLIAMVILTGSCAAVEVGPGTSINTTNVTTGFSNSLSFDNIIAKSDEIDFNYLSSWSNVSVTANKSVNMNISTWNTTGDMRKTLILSTNDPTAYVSMLITGFPISQQIATVQNGTNTTVNSNQNGELSLNANVYSVYTLDIASNMSTQVPEVSNQPTLSDLHGITKSDNGQTTSSDYGLMSMVFLVIGTGLVLRGLQMGIISMKLVAYLAIAIVTVSVIMTFGAGFCAVLSGV